MLNTAKYIAEQKIKAYEKIHIPTKDEVMEEMIAIGKAIAGTLNNTKPLKDVCAVFVENNNRDLEFYGFVGDGAGTIDTEGNLLHIGDTIEMHSKDGHTSRQYVLRILPKQKSIDFFNGKLVMPYKKLSKNVCSQDHGIFHFVSCLDEYYKSIDNLS